MRIFTPFFLFMLLYLNCNAQEVNTVNSGLFTKHFTDFAQIGSKEYYAASNFGPLFKVHLSEGVEQVELPCDCNPNFIEVEPNGGLYIADDSEGIFKINADNTFEHLLDDSVEEFAVGPNGEIVSIGDFTSDNLISIYDGSAWSFLNTDHPLLTSESLYDVKFDSRGNAWIGYGDGMLKLTGTELELITDKQVYFFHIDENDFILMAFGSGSVGSYDQDTDQLTIFPWMEVGGRFITGSKNGMMYVLDDRDLFSGTNGNWTERSYEDLDLGDAWLPRAMFMDNEGIVLFSLDFETQIYVIGSETISNKNLATISMSISPNPSADFVEITTEENLEQVNIYDISGVLVQTMDKSEITNKIDISALSNGTYFIEAKTSNGIAVKQISKI